MKTWIPAHEHKGEFTPCVHADRGNGAPACHVLGMDGGKKPLRRMVRVTDDLSEVTCTASGCRPHLSALTRADRYVRMRELLDSSRRGQVIAR